MKLRPSSVLAVTVFALVVGVACNSGDAPSDLTAADGGVGTPGSTSDGGGTPTGNGDGGGTEPPPDRCAAPPCATGERCKDDLDCVAHVCRDRICIAPSGSDGVKNGDETDTDCGGPPAGAGRCLDGKSCVEGADCQSLSCAANVCIAPTREDGIKNGTETDIDCGGGAPTDARRCNTGEACAATSDCNDVECVAGTCDQPRSNDDIKNGTETDIDCGGGAPTNARRCNTGESCTATSDCNGVKCVAGTCDQPRSNDDIKNGTETDVDCGGGAPTNAPRCPENGVCLQHNDCASDGCTAIGGAPGVCVRYPSCALNAPGTNTCGRKDSETFYPPTAAEGGSQTVAESCCATAPLSGSQMRVGRFAITAGRMRAFITRFNNNVRGWVTNAATKPAGWNATPVGTSWDVLVPANATDVSDMLGQYWNNAPNDAHDGNEDPHSKRSCGNDGYNGHTYFVPGEANQIFTQDQLDPKVLNCVGWHLIRAFCAWDGGRMATQAELRNAFTNGGSSTYPWGFAGSAYNQAYSSDNQDARLNHQFNYGFPGGQPASNRITWWLSPPGRFWRGWNANKVEIAGNVLEWTGDAEYTFAWNNSFEGHTGTMNSGGDWRSPRDRSDVPNGYYALGARCVYPR